MFIMIFLPYLAFVILILFPHLYVHIAGQVIFLLGILIDIRYIAKFWDNDYTKVLYKGPYKVGFREFRSKEYENEVSVFYPISRQEYDEKIGTHNILAMRHGSHDAQGLENVIRVFKPGHNLKRTKLTNTWFNSLTSSYTDIVKNAEVH
eukprot:CAMPEP_0170542836 /NCGR_PEP_ID=MMETSP0211-20121228/2141_1 /TAXON_ID=311385 /ORGANISM="Pseudokeronopsis sp., Strain OXSARD2" /LENGTH=148 /DNA_ID=CAMNT_0010846029 /DNA_START=192 /DNA_END=638 /DNA_ORIENTATION=+